MNLQQNKAGFSEESLRVINKILSRARKRGFITKDEKERLLSVIDIEIEASNIEADAMEEVAAALESFAGEIDNAIKRAEEEIASADKSLLSDIKEAADQAVSSQ